MNINRFFNYLLIHLVIFFSLSVNADEVAPSTITFETGRDNQNGESRLLDMNLAMQDGKRFLFGLGGDKQKTGTNLYNTGFIYLGLGSNPLKPVSVKGLLEFSGKRDQLTVFSASLPVTSKGKDSSFTFTPVIRNISLYTVGNKKVTVSSPAFGVSATTYVGKRGRLMGSAFFYDYSRNVAALTNLQVLRIFTEPTLLQASNLLKEKYVIETGMDYQDFSWSLGWNKSVSAVVPDDSEYAYVTTDFYLSSAWALNLLYGKYIKTSVDSHFGSVAISYSF